MSPPDDHNPDYSVRIPADVERPDRILAGLTARQVAMLTAAATVLWLAYLATEKVVPLIVFAVFAFPFGAAVTAVALGHRDGVGLDRLLLAAIAQARSPRRLVTAPEGVPPPPAWADTGSGVVSPAPLRLPAQAISPGGIIDLGADGVAVVCSVSTVSFALRTPSEQAALVGVFGRWLNSVSGPVQIVARAEDVDISPLISGLRSHAFELPHPELEVAALEHAGFLAELAGRRDLLRRQVLIVLREPCHPGASDRVARRADEAVAALAPAGITVRVLPGGEAAATVAACCDPWPTTPEPSAAERAAPGEAIIGGAR